MNTGRISPLSILICVLLLFGLVLSGCSPAASSQMAVLPQADQQLVATIVAATLVAQNLPLLPAEPLQAVEQLSNAAELQQPLETPGPLSSPTPTPHPMDIRGMQASVQAGNYPGSEIVIEQELDPGSNYRRFYAYYLSEGLKIYALLTVPNGEVPAGGWPAIVFNHGYIPPDVYKTTERYINYVDRLATSGYIVFRIDYRGHDRSEGEPSGAYSGPGYTADVLNAVASIRRFSQANPEKVGMWGHSMGGYLTLRTMVISKDVKAGVIWAGVVASYPDMLYNWRRGSGPTSTPRPFSRSWRAEWTALYGSPEENPEFWNSISANSFLPDLSGPIQLHHGTADTSVPVEFSHLLSQQIQSVGGTVELYTYEGDDHNIANYFWTAMDHTVAFFDRNLKNP